MTVIDTFTRKYLALEMETYIRRSRVSTVLDRISMKRGYPEEILTDKGPEFTSKVMDAWAYIRGITHRFIEPEKPSQNGYREFQR